MLRKWFGQGRAGGSSVLVRARRTMGRERTYTVFRVVPTARLLSQGAWAPMHLAAPTRWKPACQPGAWYGSLRPLTALREGLHAYQPESWLGGMLDATLGSSAVPTEVSIIRFDVVVAAGRLLDLTAWSQDDLDPLMRTDDDRACHRLIEGAVADGILVVLAPSALYHPAVKVNIIGFWGGPGQPTVDALPSWEEVERWDIGGGVFRRLPPGHTQEDSDLAM